MTEQISVKDMPPEMKIITDMLVYGVRREVD